MKSTGKFWMTGASVVMAAVLVAGCGTSAGSEGSSSTNSSGSTEKGGVLNIGAFLVYPPYEYMDSSNKPAGIEIELAEAIAEKMGMTAEFHKLDYASLIPAVANHRYDMAIGMFQDLPERRNAVNILDWTNTVFGVQVQQGNPSQINPSDLCRPLTFAQTKGSAEASAVERIASECKAAGKPSPTALLLGDGAATTEALKLGRADGIIRDPIPAKYISDQAQGKVDVAPGILPATQVPPKPTGWILAKDNPEMQKKVLDAIDALIKDGTWQAILKKGGITDTAILPPTINTQPVQK